MAVIKVDLDKAVGKIKPVHGVGQPPFSGIDFSMCKYLKEANIPFSRLHDVGGAYGRNVFVDIPNIFRNFAADAYDPDSYDFAFTDLLITALAENNVEPFFRLGVTIENFHTVRAYNIYPPEDFNKWAVICEHIIRHYTEGWANGFNYKITYWEIWNEPENSPLLEENQMWLGTKEEYYELYTVTAKHIKACFPHLKVGGYASCGFYAIKDSFNPFALSSSRTQYFIDFFEEFLQYVKAQNAPLDFFSWHSYDSIESNILYADYARNKLNEYDFTQTETSCNEWNCEPDKRGTLRHAANNTAMLTVFQHSPLDNAMFYDARLGISIYGGLFNPMDSTPYPLYYGFKCFGELYALENEVYSQSDVSTVYVCAAAKNGNGGVLIVNTGEETELNLEILKGSVSSCRIIDQNNILKEIPLPNKIGKETILFIETV